MKKSKLHPRTHNILHHQLFPTIPVTATVSLREWNKPSYLPADPPTLLFPSQHGRVAECADTRRRHGGLPRPEGKVKCVRLQRCWKICCVASLMYRPVKVNIVMRLPFLGCEWVIGWRVNIYVRDVWGHLVLPRLWMLCCICWCRGNYDTGPLPIITVW